MTYSKEEGSALTDLGASTAAGRSVAMTGPGAAAVTAEASAEASGVGSVAVATSVVVAGAVSTAAGICMRISRAGTVRLEYTLNMKYETALTSSTGAEASSFFSSLT